MCFASHAPTIENSMIRPRVSPHADRVRDLDRDVDLHERQHHEDERDEREHEGKPTDARVPRGRRASLGYHGPAVDADALAGDVARPLRHDEAHHVGDLLGRAHVAERAALVHRADVVDAHRALHEAPAHLGVDEAGRDDVHVDAVAPLLLGERPAPAPRARPSPCCTAPSSRPCARSPRSRSSRCRRAGACASTAARACGTTSAETRACATRGRARPGSVSATVWPRDAMPALFTRMSTVPKSASTAADHRLARRGVVDRRRVRDRAAAELLDLGDGLRAPTSASRR